MARHWPIAISILTLVVIGTPLGLPFADLAVTPEGWAGLRDMPRLLILSQNTLTLVTGVVLIALPLAIILAILLYRTDLTGRVALRRVLVASLFVPLPLITTAWQATLDLGGWLPASLADPTNTGSGWRPWRTGLPMAVWVHAAAGLPWALWLVGQGLQRVERDSEEAALLSAGPWRTCLFVTLPRASAALAAAALWLVVQAATEIAVTDMTLVRTYAEEVYTQIAGPEVGAGASPQAMLARAVAAAAPWIAGLTILVAVAALRWQRTAPTLTVGPEPPPLVPLGLWNGPVALLVAAPIIVPVAVPLVALITKLGQVGAAETWSATAAGQYLTQTTIVHGRTILTNVACSFVAGGTVALLALLLCWQARERHWLRAGLLITVAAGWATPGPVVGIGLKGAIDYLIDVEERLTGTTALATTLYYGPSPAPVAWAWMVRLWPFGVAFLWPAVRLIPTELFEVARLGGTSPGREFREVIWPATSGAVSAATGAVAILALGELGASKLVATAGAPSFAHEVFAQMHYGTGNTLAAMCLLLLTACCGPPLIFALIRLLGSRRCAEEA